MNRFLRGSVFESSLHAHVKLSFALSFISGLKPGSIRPPACSLLRSFGSSGSFTLAPEF